MRWIQGFINPRILFLRRPSNWKSLIVLLSDTFLYVAFTLKISFYQDVFIGLAWCKTLECYIHRTLHCDVSIISPHYQILDKLTIVDMFCCKWTSYLICLTSEVSPSMCYCSEKSILTKKINDSIYICHQLSSISAINVTRKSLQVINKLCR